MVAGVFFLELAGPRMVSGLLRGVRFLQLAAAASQRTLSTTRARRSGLGFYRIPIMLTSESNKKRAIETLIIALYNIMKSVSEEYSILKFYIKV